MKMFTSLPKNTDFYHRYAGIIPTLHQTGYLAQVISFMTEIGIIYSILYQSLIDFMPDYVQEIASTGAFIGAGLIEVGLRKFMPFSVRQILNKRYKGLDLVMTIFIFAGTLLLLVTCGVLSFKGSKDLVEWAAPDPVLETTQQIDSIAHIAELEAVAIFQKDSLATTQQYQSMLDAARTRLNGYEDKEARTGRSYASWKQRIIEKIAAIKEEQSAAMATVWKEHKLAREGIKIHRDTSTAVINVTNKKTKDAATAKVRNYGGGLGYFTIICLVILVISVVLYEVYVKGSDIEETARPSQYAFLPPVWLEAWGAASDRVNYFFRNKITSFADATPPPPLPSSIKSLYDQSQLALYGVKVESEASGDQIIRLPVQKHLQIENRGNARPEDLEKKALDYTDAGIKLESINLHEQAAEMFLKAEEVLKMYLGSEGTEENVLTLKNACIKHLNGEGENPFLHHHRRPIGFNKDGQKSCRYNGPVSNEQNGTNNEATNSRHNTPGGSEKTIIDSSLKNCIQCGNEYKPKAWNQKYCSTDCKRDYHTKKHDGQAFEPHKYHGKKK